MSILNLYRYYLRFDGYRIEQPISATLEEVANRLCSSPRYTRVLLQQMQQQGWLSWQPKVGRNKRSTLCLLQDPERLKEHLASDCLLRGQYDKALDLLEQDEQVFARLLQQTSGASMHEGRLHIQLTYRRPFQALLPHHPQRNSERFLVRQIYACLVRCDADGQVHPELAHHWHYDAENYQWRFYLRPELTFHDGQMIDAQSIVELFSGLKSLANYQHELAHLKRISAPHPREILFEFTVPDQSFAGLISGVSYSIQPVKQLQQSNSNVIGSGAFKVYTHTDKQLVLHAFNRYYGCRSLCDQITIWLFDQDVTTATDAIPHAGRSCQYYVSAESPNMENEQINQFSRQEEGAIFLLNNHHANLPLDDQQRQWLLSLLEPNWLLSDIAHSNLTPADHLLPCWTKLSRFPATQCPLPTSMTMAVYNYVTLIECAEAIAKRFADHGIQVIIHSYDYQTLQQKAAQGTLNETLILSSINLDDNRHTSAYQFLYSNPLLHHALGDVTSKWLRQSLADIRANVCIEQYLVVLEPLVATLIHYGFLQPLYHEQQVLRFHDLIKNVALTTWGWPELKQVWTSS
ncbi:SgrR family transcriptional regulator [Vibrio metschnikovii]|uniref:SgrR family transcriptional regulator n=1 Tax=Vibrio metschnikovii TaxID=28172 RepID=UPI001C2FD5F3|nr:SgrR family transcriptional regulator [Vibrio metschnikovii]